MNRLKQLEQLGQSVWLDFLSRELVTTDGVKKLIADDGIGGMTSNPAIFQKSLSQGTAYDADIKRYVEQGLDVEQIFRKLSVKDIQDAADALRPVYDRTDRADGFISIEVSPYIALDTKATTAEAKSLWAQINRPNLMIKVPGTKDGTPAIRDLTGAGFNINITLLFARTAYRDVAMAYIEGLEMRPQDEDLSHIASVASFFVSRIDTMADDRINKKLQNEPDKDGKALAAIRGKVAVANAKLAYQMFKEIFAGARWEKLAKRGARPQRLLWASTGTKNKDYSDTLYVDTLIGPQTVNTMPPETMDAFRDHGTPKATIEDDIDGAKKVLATLEKAGISLDDITDELVTDGVQKFAEAADKLYGQLSDKRSKLLGSSTATIKLCLGTAQKAIDDEIAKRSASGDARRLWAKDKTLWTNKDEDQWLGWLDVVERECDDLARLRDFAAHLEATKPSDVVLLGMGGSSLGAEVLRQVMGNKPGWPNLHVLDSTDPDQIRAVENAVKLDSTYFIVSSKSGTTLEPNILMDYFFARVSEKRSDAGKHFIAITDPGSQMEAVAKDKGFAHVFHGEKAIGGRYSVLSKFGLVPAAVMGLDVARLLRETRKMIESCGALVPPTSNPGVKLGIALGVLATQCKRDKITIVTSNALASVGTWLEQLIAESTGKHGKGLIPIDREALGKPEVYGNDRVFVHMHLGGAEDPDGRLKTLEEKGHPVIHIAIEDSYQLGQLFYLWEIAIAMAGSVLGINPFNQPDVEAAKVAARSLTDAFEKSGKLDEPQPMFSDNNVRVYAGENKNANGHNLTGILKDHLSQVKDGDYFALLAFIEQTDTHDSALQDMRLAVRDKKKVATCVEFGPRFLHSTGQDYKGGPDSGVFLTITTDHAQTLPVPDRKIDFGTVQLAQGMADFSVLVERKRRALRVHLKDTDSGLRALNEAVAAALGA
ncbi:MAG TPA: bifunctional transaldolase/phosoglucose isomerase [Rhizomicrobium sp.]|nr:bifunctional transaldolase/phosoglucose isomerase [Rhizomicrobium sp.]